MAYDTLPIHGNPNGAAFGVIGEQTSSDLGAVYVKSGSENDLLNIGWKDISSLPPTPTPSVTPFLTPTVTPTITPTPSITPTITPTITHTPGATPTPTPTPSITPTHTVTPSITPTNTVTPSVTTTIGWIPTPTPTPITYFTLYTTSSVAAYGPYGETPGSQSIQLQPPGGVYASGTYVTASIVLDSNSSGSLYKDGTLVGTSTGSVQTTILMTANHTASAIIGWKNVHWQLFAIPSAGGSPSGSGNTSAGFTKKGGILTLEANPFSSSFINWVYSNSPPAYPSSPSTTAVLANEGEHLFFANYNINTYLIDATYDFITGTSSFSYIDVNGAILTPTRSGTPSGFPPPLCGRLLVVYTGTAVQSGISCS